MLNTRQCIDQMKLYIVECQSRIDLLMLQSQNKLTKLIQSREDGKIIGTQAVIDFFERHHQDMVNYTEEESLPSDFQAELDRKFEDVQSIL